MALPFFAGEVSAQGLSGVNDGPGTYSCNTQGPQGLIVHEIENCEGHIIEVDGPIVWVDILIDAETGAFISVVGPSLADPWAVENPSVVGPGLPVRRGGGLSLAEEAALFDLAEDESEAAAAAESFRLQQADEEKACRGVPLALKRLLCAAKI